jgi:hypothetical protein
MAHPEQLFWKEAGNSKLRNKLEPAEQAKRGEYENESQATRSRYVGKNVSP